ncbi:MAG: hypothetical protein QM702_21025 [Rubrivivax sp.]
MLAPIDGAKPDVQTSSDAGIDVFGLDSCVGLSDGQYCGNNRLKGYPYKDDLVVCSNNKIYSVKTCTKGVGCIHLPDPFADECDECAGKANGYYCGRQLSGWKTENANVQVQCMNGSYTTLKICKTSCTNGATAVCN